MKLSIYIISLFLFCVSCTKEVEIAIPGYEEQIVIDGTIKTGQPAIVLLSTTANIYSPTNLEAYLSGFISGATVVVSDGSITDTLVEICTDNLPPGTEELAAAFFGLPVEEIVNLKELNKSLTIKAAADSDRASVYCGRIKKLTDSF